MSAATRRVFFALWPDVVLRDTLGLLARQVARESGGGATSPDTLHLTLAFLGEQTPERIDLLGTIAGRISGDGFELELDEIGSFPRAGIAWLGASVQPQAMAALHRALAGALREEAFPVEERPFAPHLTLARRARRAVQRRLSAPVTWRVSSFCLIVSETGLSSPAYRSIGEWPLDAAR